MNKTAPRQTSGKPTFWKSLTAAVGGEWKLEKAQLEAFLSAAPCEYCGFSPGGQIAYSPGFASLLNLREVRTIEDVQSALCASDAAALAGLFERLQSAGEPFVLTARTADRSRTVRLSGRHGQAVAANNIHFNILWVEDITLVTREQDITAGARKTAEEERDRLQAALDQQPYPVWMRNSRTEIIWCNRAYARALDISPATVIAEQRELNFKPSKKMSGPATPRALAQAALDQGQNQSLRAHLIIGGQRRLVTISELPMSGLGQTLGLSLDITREEELETEQKRYAAANRELLEQLGSAIGIFDSQQRLEFYNTAFSQLWSFEEQYLNTGPKLGDLMERMRENRRLPEQADFRRFKQTWLNMFTGLIGPHEDMLYLPNGNALRMLVIPHPLGGLMMTFEDVTSRLELESSYNTLVAVQRETLDNLTEGVVVFGGDGRLKLWNPSFATLWNLHPEDLKDNPHINRLIEKMKASFTTETWPAAREILLRQGLERASQDGLLMRHDGSQISWSTMPLPDGGVLITHIDSTDKMRVENALREKNDALETAERLKLDFLANVSYQLRTPLSAIMGFNEILQNEYFGPLNARQKEYTSGTQEAGERLIQLIDDILDLSTIEAGQLSLTHDTINISQTLHHIYDLTREWGGKERILILLECVDDIGTMKADERRLKQVLLNLMRNAINFTPAGGKIILAARRHEQGIHISVSDTGPGILPEDQQRIFLPFERAQSGSTPGTRGAGLGLSLVKTIVELQGGRITLESEVNKGTTVHLWFPPE
ncbi:MAG: PAS-domain containing protein [Alphaproteobacteria bacterium]|nr:PAS-domain containing protein [Alphaproteobacteria bacterium]